MVHRGVAVVLAGGCAAACLTATACGGGDPLASMSGKQVLDKAVGNLKAAPSFEMAGKVSETDGAYTVNLGILNHHGCKGTIAQSGKGSIAVIIIGDKAWVKPDDNFIKSVAGNQASAVIAQIGGKYLAGSTSNANVASLATLCDVNTITSQFLQSTDVAKGQVTTRNGQQALPLTDKAKGGTLYVTDSSTPQVLEVVNTTAGNNGTVTFDVGAPVTLTPPPANQTVDGAQYGF